MAAGWPSYRGSDEEDVRSFIEDGKAHSTGGSASTHIGEMIRNPSEC